MILPELSESTSLTRVVEETAFLIRQSEAIQLARADAFLDGIVLAAEQVQDQRIRLAEQKPEPSGWEILGSVLLTFVLESNVAGKVVQAASRQIVSKLLRQSDIFMALPKSPTGVELARQAERLARMNPQQSRRSVLRAVTQLGVGGGPGLRHETEPVYPLRTSTSIRSSLRLTFLTGLVLAVKG